MIIIAAFVLLNYPEPYTPIYAEDTNHLFARTLQISNITGSENTTFTYVAGIQIKLDLVTSSGFRNMLNMETNSSGVIDVEINSGYYRLTVGNWWSGYLVINKATEINITKYNFIKQPSSLNIFSISKNWTISKGDLLEASFTNNLVDPVQIESIHIGNQIILKENDKVLPAAEWQGTYTVPNDIFIPWSDSNRNLILALQLSYTEVNIDS